MHLSRACLRGQTKINQLLLVMQLTGILLTLCCLTATAKVNSQITLRVNNVPLKEVFNQIHEQSGFDIFYNGELLRDAGTVTMDVNNVTLQQALDASLKGKQLSYRITEQTVVISAIQPPVLTGGTPHSLLIATPITGIVRGADGKPLEGVNVIIKGSNVGTVTDVNGKFSIDAKSKDKLVFSSIGFSSREIIVDINSRAIDIALNINLSPLDEVQVQAYGTTSRRFSVGNITTVKGDDIIKQPVNNPLLALSGYVSGVFITQNTGVPGGGITVRIQGQNSIAGGNDPLIVIDGVPFPTQLPAAGRDGILGSSGGGGAGAGNVAAGNPLTFINPSDIESIDVLKDADATSIYGSRAGNGAILITTKQGKFGKTKFDLNLQKGWGKVTRFLQVLDRRQYLDMRYEAFRNDSTSPSLNGFPPANDLLLWDTSRSTNWQKLLIGSTSKVTNINANVSGGTSGLQYLIGGTYRDETTVFPGDFADQKGSIHFSVNSNSLNQRFKMQFSGNYMLDDNKLPGSDYTEVANQLEPIAPAVYNPDGTLNWAPDAFGKSTWDNPLVRSLYNKYENKTVNLLANAIFSYTIFKGMEVKTSLGYNSLQTKDFNGVTLDGFKPEDRPYVARRAEYGDRQMSSWIIEPQLTYKRNILSGKLDGFLGMSIQQNRAISGSIIGVGYSNDQVLEDPRAALSLIAGNSSVSEYKYNAAFGRVNYNWEDKYIINLNGRRDGSSRFGSQNHFHNFGSIGTAWIFSQEPFMEESSAILSFGKLRFSYGTTGNDQIGDYSYLSLYGISNAGVPYQNTNGLIGSGLSNPYLEWEETNKLQYGIDLAFFKDKLIFGATYSRNHSSNQLLPYQLPSVTGYNSIIRNFPATVQNTSWEFTITTTNIKTKQFSWTTSFNLTLPQNKLIAFPDLEKSTYASQLNVGRPLQSTKVYHYLGVDPAMGEYQVADKDGKPTANPNPETDQTVFVNTLPKLYGGFQNRISFNGFELDFSFQFVQQKGRNIFFNNGTIIGPGVFSTGVSNQPVSILDRWKQPGDIVDVRKFSTDFIGSFLAMNLAKQSDALFTDASYARLKNLSMSWELPYKWKQKMMLQNCRLYIQGQNLLTITKYKGTDPENQDQSSLPPLKIWTAGVQLAL